MKYVLVSLSEASKLDFAGADKLAKSDHIVFLHVKGKKTVSAKLQATMDEWKAEVDYYEIASASELWLYVSYLIGYHAGAKHDVFVVTADKSKLPSKIAKDAKIYTSFKSISTSSGTGKTGTSSNAATGKKKTSSKKKSEEDALEDVIGAFTSGDKDKAKKELVNLAAQFLKG